MKKYLWIILAIILVAVLSVGIALVHRSGASIDRASSSDGETEIIPEDPNEPLPDLSADASSDTVSDPGAASLPTSSGISNNSGSVSSGNTVVSSDGSSASSSTSSGNAASSGSSTSSEGSVSAGNSDTSDTNPDSGVPPVPDSGSENADPVISAEGLHEYELPYVPLS